jgi:hypothetical protein
MLTLSKIRRAARQLLTLEEKESVPSELCA